MRLEDLYQPRIAPSAIKINLYLRFILIQIGIPLLYAIPWIYLTESLNFIGKVLGDPNPLENAIEKSFLGGPFLLSIIIAIIVDTVAIMYLIKTEQLKKEANKPETFRIFIQKLRNVGFYGSLAFSFATLITNFAIWVNYSLYLGNVDSNLLIWAFFDQFLQSLVIIVIINMVWDHYVVDAYVSHAKTLGLTRIHGIPYRWKILILVYVLPLLTLILASAPQDLLELILQKQLTQEQLSIFYIFAVILLIITGIIEAPIVFGLIRQNSRLMNLFKDLAVESTTNNKPSNTTKNPATPVLKEIYLRSADEFGLTLTYYNHFIEKIRFLAGKTSEGAQQAVTFFDQIAESLKELASMSQDIASTVGQVTDSSQRQADYLQDLSTLVEETRNLFVSLVEQANQVGKELGAITSQIRVVSLNASIEAARAGEQGKGFAVVAQTIRELNRQSQELYDSLQNVLKERLNEIIQKFSVITKSTEEVASIGEENAASAEEVSASIEEETAIIQELNERAKMVKESLNEAKERIEQYKYIDVL